jgi:hypothetical protein
MARPPVMDGQDMRSGNPPCLCLDTVAWGLVLYTPTEPLTYEEPRWTACIGVMMSLSALRGTRHARNSIQTTLGLS